MQGLCEAVYVNLNMPTGSWLTMLYTEELQGKSSGQPQQP